MMFGTRGNSWDYESGGGKMKPSNRIVFTLALAFLGYLGAAAFYSYLIGLNLQTQYACPVCPSITSLGSPFSKFMGSVLALGTLNAALFMSLGWLLVGAARLAKRVS
jgi:hypothetical protein